tara:strand:+ start:50540 stop:50974 length:435 start_codon:yes stop_codon:yes gene_type:complete
MKKFEKVLNEELESLPDGSEVRSKLDVVLNIQRDIQDAREKIEQLDGELYRALEDYNFALGAALRKRLPKVGVDFANGKCSTRYKSANLSCRPDVKSQSWVFEPNQHGRRFSKKNAHLLSLSDEVAPLVDAMVGYLTNRYRSLG